MCLVHGVGRWSRAGIGHWWCSLHLRQLLGLTTLSYFIKVLLLEYFLSLLFFSLSLWVWVFLSSCFCFSFPITLTVSPYSIDISLNHQLNWLNSWEVKCSGILKYNTVSLGCKLFSCAAVFQKWSRLNWRVESEEFRVSNLDTYTRDVRYGLELGCKTY